MFKILSHQKNPGITQNTYKVEYNGRYYNFVDYVWEETGWPLAEGSFSSLTTVQGQAVKDGNLLDIIGGLIDEQAQNLGD